MSVITLENISKSYDNQVVLNHISLSIQKGEFVVLLGPSGCGKTTLLKIINGLIPYEEGSVYINGKKKTHKELIALRRKIGYVIQNIGLFPHLTIEKNITYVPTIEGNKDKIALRKKAEELITLVGLDKTILSRYPHELSGGQRQRIGVARALAADPDIILMDEPFGAVDEIARTKLQDEFLELHKRLKKTIVFVTHDIHEAQKLGSKIVLMDKGNIVQVGTKEELQFHPKNNYVKEFFGMKGFKYFFKEEDVNKLYQEVLENKISIEDILKRK